MHLYAFVFDQHVFHGFMAVLKVICLSFRVLLWGGGKERREEIFESDMLAF